MDTTKPARSITATLLKERDEIPCGNFVAAPIGQPERKRLESILKALFNLINHASSMLRESQGLSNGSQSHQDLISLNRWAGADGIAIAENVVDATDWWPEFVLPQPLCRIRRLLT